MKRKVATLNSAKICLDNLDNGVHLRGRAHDNIFVERLWRSVKYEEVYPHGYETMDEAYHGLYRYFEFYNHQRPHQALDYRTPEEVYEDRAVTLSTIDAEDLP